MHNFWDTLWLFLFLSFNIRVFGISDDAFDPDLDAIEDFPDSDKSKISGKTKEENPGSSASMIELFKSINSTLAQMNQKKEKDDQLSTFNMKDLLAEINKRLEKLEQKTNTKSSPTLDVTALINNPSAKLFSGDNYDGKTEDYRNENSTYGGGCHDLKKFKGKVKSVKTFGKCVRLFNRYRCCGWSLAIYPGSHHEKSILNSKIKRVRSIGPCISDEFENAYLEDTSVIKKNPNNIRQYVPDLVGLHSDEEDSGAVTPNTDFPVAYYTLGVKNRLELTRAEIMSDHLTISQPKYDMENTDYYKGLEKENGDSVGYAIPISIGGPANETYNVFPASQTGRNGLLKLASKIQGYLGKNPEARLVLALLFNYEDATKTRPYAFYYWICYNRRDIEYGHVGN